MAEKAWLYLSELQQDSDQQASIWKAASRCTRTLLQSALHPFAEQPLTMRTHVGANCFFTALVLKIALAVTAASHILLCSAMLHLVKQHVCRTWI